MANQRKIDQVKELSDKLSKGKAIILTDYRGLTHKQLEDIKKNLKKTEADFIVAKNSLLAKAFGFTHLKDFSEVIKKEVTGPTAVLIAKADEITPLKELFKFIKTLSLPQIKFGYLADKQVSGEEISRLVKLPTRNVLLAQLVGQMKSPLYGLHRSLNWNLQKFVMVLNSVKNKKTS